MLEIKDLHAEIDEKVKESKAYKLKASSLSALGSDVFLATHATNCEWAASMGEVFSYATQLPI